MTTSSSAKQPRCIPPLARSSLNAAVHLHRISLSANGWERFSDANRELPQPRASDRDAPMATRLAPDACPRPTLGPPGLRRRDAALEIVGELQELAAFPQPSPFALVVRRHDTSGLQLCRCVADGDMRLACHLLRGGDV